MSDTTRGLRLADVPAIGLGCMNLSHAYGHPPSKADAERVLHRAFDIGIRHFDSAALYGFGRNEELVGPVLRDRRDEILLVTKCGMTGVDGKRVIDGRPGTIVRTCDESLKRLRTDFIDLWYLHRWDKQVPVEDSIGAMSRLVEAGKVGELGLSEVSAGTLRKAHAVHPIAAVQSEYSLWSRNVELAVLDACGELGVTFVAFSPLARGFLTDVDVVPGEFAGKDIRRGMPRFQSPNFERNAALLAQYRQIARDAGCTAAQLALAWLLQRHPGMHVIPGTTQIAHLEENFRVLEIELSSGILDRADALINTSTIAGPRYPDATQAEIDTERFGSA